MKFEEFERELYHTKVLYFNKKLNHTYESYEYPEIKVYANNKKVVHIWDAFQPDKHIWFNLEDIKTYEVERVDDKTKRLLLYLDKYQYKLYGYFMLQLK